MGWKPWVRAEGITVHCKDCTAECCKHIAVPIEDPSSFEDFQRIADYLQHPNITVYCDEEKEWLVEFRTRCSQLDGNRCRIWGTDRYPKICGEYKMSDCVMNVPGPYWTVLFDTPAQVAEYAAKKGIAQPIRTTPLCTGDCRYIRIPADAPESLRDYDDFWWYVAHPGVVVYSDNGNWFVRLEASRACTCSPRKELHDVELSSWESIMAHCQRLGLVQPALRVVH